MHKFGLRKEILDSIIQVFKDSQKVKEVKIFGSRALGRQHAGSDIDLAVYGTDLSLNDILSLKLELDNLMLPYQFDLVNMNTLSENESLFEHINRVGVSIYQNHA